MGGPKADERKGKGKLIDYLNRKKGLKYSRKYSLFLGMYAYVFDRSPYNDSLPSASPPGIW
jgi:hypothetical protein